MTCRIAFAPVLILLTALAAPAAAQEKSRLIRLSYGSDWEALPAVVGIERGFFTEQNLIVSGMPIGNSMAAIQSVVTGSSDFALVPQRTLLVMAASKLDFAVVSMGAWGEQMEVVVPPGDTKTKSIAGLKGKTIAMVRGSEALATLMRLLNREKMRPTDVKLLRTSTQQVTRALKEKKADAVFASRQVTMALVVKKEARVAVTNKQITDAIGRIGAMPLIVNKTLLQKEPETVQKFVNAWVKSMVYIRQDPKDAATVLRIFFHRQGVKIPADLAEAWVALGRYDRLTWDKQEIADANYNGWGLKTGNILKVQPEVGPYVNNRFAEKAIAQLQAQAKAEKK